MTITPPAPAPSDPSTRALRIALIDDHQLLTESLALALQLEGVVTILPDLSDRDALTSEVVAARPDLVLLDLDLGGAIGDGSMLVAPLVAAGCRVLVVSASNDQEQVGRAMEIGAAGVLRKDVPFTRLLDAALAAARGEDVMAQGARQRLLDEARAIRTRRAEDLKPFQRLSVREAEVLRALALGQAVGAIAVAAYVSEATVRSQVRAVLTKLGVCSQLEAVALAHRHGWL
jgi:DNA-binding NarL/FixJ family response regulator